MTAQAQETTVHQLSDDSFSDLVLRVPGVAVVDFHGAWDPPWLGLSESTRAALAARYGQRVRLAELDTAQNTKTAEAYGVDRIPNVFVFVGGRIERQFIGNASLDSVSAALDKAIAISTGSQR